MRDLHRRLLVRIAAISALAIPAIFFLFVNLNFLLVRVLGLPDTVLANMIQIALLVISVPLVIGFAVSRLIGGPLRRFQDAIAALAEGPAIRPIAPSGIVEFDQVTDRFNAMARRLASEEDLRAHLISDTSHELYTPLTAIQGQLIAMEDGVLPVTPERIANLSAQTARLIDLVAQLDAYARARAPRPPGPAASIAVREVCDAIVAAEDNDARAAGVTLAVEVPVDLVVTGDRAALHQILRNVVHNGIRHARCRTIVISGDRHHVAVRDDGVGVPAEHLPHLFERFYRVDASRSRASGGLGLGLAIAREQARQQGWQIRARRPARGAPIRG